jgi:hypothetical protein
MFEAVWRKQKTYLFHCAWGRPALGRASGTSEWASAFSREPSSPEFPLMGRGTYLSALTSRHGVPLDLGRVGQPVRASVPSQVERGTLKVRQTEALLAPPSSAAVTD